MPILRLTIVLILAALWVVPAPVRAQDDTTCPSLASTYVGASSNIDVVVTNVSVVDGTAAVHGVVLLGEGRERSVLVAEGTGGTAACADADFDGLVGVVELAAPFLEARTGETVEVRITATEGHDLDEPGLYPVTIAIDDRVVAAEVRLVGAAPGPR